MTEKEAVDRFNHRILGMMADYRIPMSEALWWDYEGFYNDVRKIYEQNGWEAIEKSFEKYLRVNEIKKEENVIFYRDVFTGKSNDLTLKELK